MRNSPFERLYNKNGILKIQYHYLLRRPCHKEKTKKAKERMRQFMTPEQMHLCLVELLQTARRMTPEEMVMQRMDNGMTFGDFCSKCILARWA
ncbi:MAG: hypothetical protein EB060_12225 [Proteobacteria bacterium]|nr:hypothetical protein [Pseudomonadota bacterium]